MSYPSVDEIQKLLASSVFADRRDAAKAAGRALGTFIEIIVYYLLCEWGFSDSMIIENPVPEYSEKSISHNVEFTLHPLVRKVGSVPVSDVRKGITPLGILRELGVDDVWTPGNQKPVDSGVVKNAAVVGVSGDRTLLGVFPEQAVNVFEVYNKPFAMFECKRVGKEGDHKGPQTIEKAKQGAYVARMVSSLQRIYCDGRCDGILYVDGVPVIKPYSDFLKVFVEGDISAMHRDFCLTVGVVSNHGNWFTSGNQNKELKVLASSYDWLLFLTDAGLVDFVGLMTDGKHDALRAAFEGSYVSGEKKKLQQFTKKSMDVDAHRVLMEFMHEDLPRVEGWFNVITPAGKDINELRTVLSRLRNKEWGKIL